MTDDREAEVAASVGELSIALQRAGVLSKSHMTYHDIARCVIAALGDGRDDLGAPAIHDSHAVAAAIPGPALDVAARPRSLQFLDMVRDVNMAQIVHEALGHTEAKHDGPTCAEVADRVLAKTMAALSRAEWSDR